jgi:hypothetical protein
MKSPSTVTMHDEPEQTRTLVPRQPGPRAALRSGPAAETPAGESNQVAMPRRVVAVRGVLVGLGLLPATDGEGVIRPGTGLAVGGGGVTLSSASGTEYPDCSVVGSQSRRAAGSSDLLKLDTMTTRMTRGVRMISVFMVADR